MKDIAIYGAGGFGREIALMIEQINASGERAWKLLGFYDDNKTKASIVDGLPVLGTINDLNDVETPLSLVIAIADPLTRNRIQSKITQTKIDFPTLIHPSAQLGDMNRNRFGQGAIITAGTVFTTGIHIEDFAIINLSCTIGHDVVIGRFSTVMPGCSISGAVHTGSMVMVGSGACILPGISIGDKTRIGAGAVVTKEIPADVTAVGVPAKVVKN